MVFPGEKYGRERPFRKFPTTCDDLTATLSFFYGFRDEEGMKQWLRSGVKSTVFFTVYLTLHRPSRKTKQEKSSDVTDVVQIMVSIIHRSCTDHMEIVYRSSRS